MSRRDLLPSASQVVQDRRRSCAPRHAACTWVAAALACPWAAPLTLAAADSSTARATASESSPAISSSSSSWLGLGLVLVLGLGSGLG